MFFKLSLSVHTFFIIFTFRFARQIDLILHSAYCIRRRCSYMISQCLKTHYEMDHFHNCIVLRLGSSLSHPQSSAGSPPHWTISINLQSCHTNAYHPMALPWSSHPLTITDNKMNIRNEKSATSFMLSGPRLELCITDSAH